MQFGPGTIAALSGFSSLHLLYVQGYTPRHGAAALEAFASLHALEMLDLNMDLPTGRSSAVFPSCNFMSPQLC